MARLLVGASLCVAAVRGGGPRLPVPEFEVNLDLAPEERFTEIVPHFKEPLLEFAQHMHAGNPIVKLIAKEIVKHRGPENDELQREIQGVAELLGVQTEELQMVQMLYELNSLMIPVVNLTGRLASDKVDLEEVASLLEATVQRPSAQDHPFPIRFGCTGIIALNKEDGMVYHARNLDFSYAEYLQRLAYTGIYTKNGTEVFRAQTIAGYSSIITGMRKGPNGYAVELNTRFTDHFGGNSEMFRNLFKNKRDISGWTKRKILEEHDNYEDAVEAFSNTPYSAAEYNIVSGVKKGTILARNADGLAYQLPLNESSKDYIIMTNFDYIYHDIKEMFDPTGGKGKFHPRRKAAEKILDHAEVITPELLFEVINDFEVMAKDTMFQVIMNVETGLWNASLPACATCGRSSALLV